MNNILASGPNPPSRYRSMVRALRADLVHEKDCLYFIHTPVGLINVSTWDYTIPGFVAVTGEDEDHKYRFRRFRRGSNLLFSSGDQAQEDRGF